MALVHISGTVARVYANITPLIEDPNPTQNRLFFTAQGHDGTYLNPIFGSQFHYHGPSTPYQSAYTFANLPTVPNNGFGSIALTKASVACYTTSDNSLDHHQREAWCAFHSSLDPVNYPARRNWYTVNNRVIMTYPYTDNGSSGQGAGNYLIYPSDITTGALYLSNNNVYAPTTLFFEDAVNQRLWGMQQANAYYGNIIGVTNYDNPTNIAFNGVDSAGAYMTWFLGADVANNIYVVASQPNQAGEPFYVWRYSATPAPITPVKTQIFGTGDRSVGGSGGTYTYRHTTPSNVRYDNATARVFYSSHFDGMNELKPQRFTWDPTRTDGLITATTCTMVYAVGTYTNYSQLYQNTAFQTTYAADSWRMHPWQFRPANTTTWYLTFWPIDKIAGYGGSAPTRWDTPERRTMMTYSINTTTDTTSTAYLTYHSSYTFPSIFEIPREFLPINAEGTQMAVPVYSKVNFFTFNPTLGWGLTNSYPYEMRTLGLDSQNRLWGQSTEIGNFAIHLITPTVPYTVSVVMSSSTYTYTGTNILTSATVSVYDPQGALASMVTNLSINGNSMLFTDNGTTSLTTTTNTLTGTTVNLTIFGGGVNNIVVGANI